MTAFADLGDLPEDERIAIIGRAITLGHTVGFVVDDNEKADRYIAKLQERFKVNVIARGAGPVKDSIAVKVGPILN